MRTVTLSIAFLLLAGCTGTVHSHTTVTIAPRPSSTAQAGLRTTGPGVRAARAATRKAKPKPRPRNFRNSTRRYKLPSRRYHAPHPARASGRWERLRRCESSGNYQTDTGNGFGGAYQFTRSSWRAVGGSGNPAHASRSEQDRRAKALLRLQGPKAWPKCGHYLND